MAAPWAARARGTSVSIEFTGLRAAIALVACAASGAAQQVEIQRIAVHVTAVQDTRAYLDLGSDAGIAVGDRVELHPDGQSMLEATVRSVTRNSARIDWSGVGALEIGTSGEVLVPADRKPAGTVEHPPWTQGADKFDPKQPLLAPVKGIDNWKRDPRLHGRWFAQGDWTSINVNGQQDYSLARTGLDFALDNPFGKGGALEFDGELYSRSQSLWDSGNDSESSGRIDQLSTWWGGVRGKETRYEAGRFLQHEFPEFGLIDGAEVTLRTKGGDRYGASAGFLPEIDASRSSGDDTALSAYYRHVVGEDEHAAIGLGVQKTWHKGQADRDLAVLNGHWRAGSRWWLYGSTWIDMYGSEDKSKSAGAEVTQANANVNYRFDNGFSLGLNASQFRWPELLRNEFPATTSTTLSDGSVTRVGLNASKSLGKYVWLWARADRWNDQDDSGGNYEVRSSLRNALYERGELSAGLFMSQGKFSDFSGVRLGLMKSFDIGTCRLDYELAQAEQQDFNGAQSSLTQHAVRASFDTSFWKSWTFMLSGESRFGDEQDSLSIGFFLQRRF